MKVVFGYLFADLTYDMISIIDRILYLCLTNVHSMIALIFYIHQTELGLNTRTHKKYYHLLEQD